MINSVVMWPAFISRSVINNSVSSTVIIGFSKTKWVVSKLAGLALGGVCHWPSVLRSIRHVGKKFACRDLSNNSYFSPYCMVSIIPGFPLQCRMCVYCLVCVMHRWNRVISSHVSCVFFMSCCYWSPWLSYIWIVARVTPEFAYPAGICAGLNYVVSELLMYIVCGT